MLWVMLVMRVMLVLKVAARHKLALSEVGLMVGSVLEVMKVM